MTTNPQPNPGREPLSDHIRALAAAIHTDNPKDKLFLVSAALELLRRAQQIDKTAPLAIVNFIARVTDVPWKEVGFSFTRTLLPADLLQACQGDSDCEAIGVNNILESVAIFADILEDAPKEATQEVFLAVAADVAQSAVPAPPPPVPKPAPVKAPEVFRPSMLKRCFTPAEVTAKQCQELGLIMVRYRRELDAGRLGAEVRGFMHMPGPDEELEKIPIILETGELVYVVSGAKNVSCVSDPEDYMQLPIALLAYATVCGEQMLISSDIRCTTYFGAFSSASSPIAHFIVSEADVTPGGNNLGPKSFAVFGTSVNVVFELAVNINSGRYYSTAKLEGPLGQVIMRNDFPREHNFKGCYIFPRENAPAIIVEVL